MTIKLFCNAIIKFVLGIILVGLLLFLPAGTVQYPNGWLLMGVLFVPMFVAGIVMMFKNPQLLSKRLNAKEQQSEQSLVIKLSGLMFVVGFVLAGLDFRFGWLSLPKTVPYIAAAIFLIAYLLYAEVLRENTYLSRTIEVQENQKVIDTGLYGIVRHPMVSAKYSCGFPTLLFSFIIVVERYLDYFTTIMEDRLWQVLARPAFRWWNRSDLSMNAARAA